MKHKTEDIILRDATSADCDEILRMNEESVHYLSPMDMERLKKLKAESELLWVAECGEAGSGGGTRSSLGPDGTGSLAAFIIAFREGADYDSVNYQWFEKNFEKFLYIDRVVVDIPTRKYGIGKLIYDKIFEYGKKNDVERITAEIDIEPENPISLEFHKKYGFREVGRQEVAGGTKIVSLQSSQLD